MPALADLAPLLYGVITLLLAVAVITFGKFLAQLVPDLPVIGSRLRNGVISLTEDAGRWLVGQTHASWRAASNILLGITWLDKTITLAIISVLDHLGQQASHILATEIHDITSTQSNIDRVVSVTMPAAIASAVDVVESDLSHTATNLQHNIDTAVSVTVPHDIAVAKSAVEGEVATTATNLQHNIDSLSGEVTGWLASVWAAIDPLQTAVSSTIPASIAATASKAAADTQAAQQTEQANLVSATQALQGNLNTVSAQLQQAIAAEAAAAAAVAAADLNTAEGQAAADSASAVQTAAAAAAAGLRQVQGELQAAIDANTAQIAKLAAVQAITLPGLPDVTIPGTITVPVAVGALAAAVAGIITEVDNCMVSACEGPHSLANELSKLEGLFTITGELGFLAAAIKDPVGTEQIISGVLRDAYGAGHDALDALLSI